MLDTLFINKFYRGDKLVILPCMGGAETSVRCGVFWIRLVKTFNLVQCYRYHFILIMGLKIEDF